MMRCLQAILIVGILICMTAALPAQELPFRNLRVPDGLPSNFTTAISQDSDGRLWIGTTDGVVIFDGVACTPLPGKLSLPRTHIYSICPDSHEGMWITTHDSLMYVHAEYLTAHRFRSSEERFTLIDVQNVPGHGIWVGGSGGLARVQDGALVSVAVPRRLRPVVKMHADANGMLWILNANGLHTFDPASGIGRTVDSISGQYFGANSVRSGRNGDIFVCTRDSSILQFRNHRLLKRHRVNRAQPFDVLQDESGSWWITSNDGLFFCEGDALDLSKAARYTTENKLPSNRLTFAMEDAEHVLWFRTQGNGIISLEDRSVQIFHAHDMAGKGAEDRHGRLWMTSHLGIWEYWREESRWQRKLHERQPTWPAGYSYHIQATENDRLWVSFQSGAIAVFDIQRPASEQADLPLLRLAMPVAGLPKPDPFCFLIDRHDRLWTKIRISDLAVIDIRTPGRPLRVFKSFHSDIRALYEDPSGVIWLGGYRDGVFVYEDDQLGQDAFRRLEFPERANIRAFLRDRRGRMWLGTMNGVLISSETGWKRIDIRDGLPNNRVFALAEGQDGRMWLGTQTGVASINGDLTSVYRHLELTDSPVGACGVQQNGLVWIATSFGLTLYDRSRSIRDTVPPVISFRGMYVNGTTQVYSDDMHFSSGENNIRIDVATVRMRNADAVRYQYRFIGIDSSWSTASASRSFFFPALQPGSYTLEIRSMNAELIPSAVPLLLRFHVNPPFWLRWWFYPAIVVTLGLLLFTLYRIRLQRLLAAERIRTRIAADLHDDIGSGLTRIAMMSDVMMQQTRQVSDRFPTDSAASVDGLRNTISRSGTIARELVESMSDVVWSLDPRNDTIGQLADRLRVFAFDLADGAEIALDFTVSAAARQLHTRSEVSRSLLLVMKEALSNTVRHANASHLRVRITTEDATVSFRVEDDGCGFNPETLSRRSGLAHMEQRAASCGGHVEIRSDAETGTCISGTIPLS